MTNQSEGQLEESVKRWGSILTVLILTGICVLSLILNYQSATASEMLPVSIQAKKVADYSADEFSVANPVVNMEIIEAALKDQDPTNVAERLENVRMNLQTGVPTVTPTAVNTITPIPDGGQPTAPQGTQTKTRPATSTPRPPVGTNTRPSNTATPPPGETATATKTGTLDPTLVPSNTPVKTATATGLAETTPTNLSTATSKPTHTSTKPPVATNTATNTPTNAPPTATKTATNTPTKVPPTATWTPTPECTRPDRKKGYVVFIEPRDGAKDVPRDVTVVIQFDQPMNVGSLFKEIRVSGAGIDHVIRYDSSTYRAEIVFLGLLDRGSEVKVEVKKNIKNICGWRQKVNVDAKFKVIE